MESKKRIISTEYLVCESKNGFGYLPAKMSDDTVRHFNTIYGCDQGTDGRYYNSLVHNT